MKTFILGVVLLVGVVSGVVMGTVAERRRPIPAEEVRFDPDSFCFVRDAK